MTPREKFTSFFSPQYLNIGAHIVKYLSVRELVEFMQINDQFKDFILYNASICKIFVKKAQIELTGFVNFLDSELQKSQNGKYRTFLETFFSFHLLILRKKHVFL